MADLSGSLSQIGNIVLLSEAATAFQEMATAFGKDIPIEVGYMSEWDLYQEYADCYAPQANAYLTQTAITNATETFNATIKGLVTKPDPTPEDRTTLKEFFKNKGYGWLDYSKQKTAPGSDNLKWYAFQKYKVSWPHPVLKDGTELYPAPNFIEVDPRRSGRYILIAGQDANQLAWLFQNSYKYGFTWHGPQDGAFFYIGKGKVLSPASQEALTLGLESNMYGIVKAQTGTAPTSKQQVESYLKTLVPTLPEAEKAKYTWTYWGVVMNIMS